MLKCGYYGYVVLLAICSAAPLLEGVVDKVKRQELNALVIGPRFYPRIGNGEVNWCQRATHKP